MSRERLGKSRAARRWSSTRCSSARPCAFLMQTGSEEPAPASSDAAFLTGGFFALRTPLLPFDDFLAWSEGLEARTALQDPARIEQALASDRARLRERLSALVAQPLI